MEARGALLSNDSYSPPVYDEVAGMQPGVTRNPVASQQQPRAGVSRGRGGDEYVALGAEDDENPDSHRAAQNHSRANEIAMRRQQEHAKAFQRQIEAEEQFLRSSSAQVQRDAEVAARLARGTDENASMQSIQQAQRDAEVAARLQQQYDAERGGRPRASSGGDGRDTQRTVKTIRVLVPASAKPGDSLAVKTSTTGKFEVTVPAWARPNTHFDCVVTTTIQLRRPGGAVPQAQPGGYQPPTTSPDLPSGWERAVNSTGNPFYIDHNTRTTHWSAPTFTPPAASPTDQTSGMTEEEMLAEAIARSLHDAPNEEEDGDDDEEEEEEDPRLVGGGDHEQDEPETVEDDDDEEELASTKKKKEEEQPDLLGLEDDA